MRVNEHSFAVILTVVLGCAQITAAKPVEKTKSRLYDDRIEALKQKILMGLNYTSIPAVSTLSDSVHEKRRMIQRYREYIRQKGDRPEPLAPEEELTVSTGTNFLSFKYTVEMGEHKNSSDATKSDHVTRLRFRISEKHPDDDHTMETAVQIAKLKIFKHSSRMSKSDVSSDVVIAIFQIQKDYNRKKFLQSRIVDISREGWEIFDITNTVQDWIDNPETNFGIEIHSDTLNIGELVFPDSNLHIDDSFNNSSMLSSYPVLEIQTHKRSIMKRVKRQDSGRRDCTKGDGENRCCRFRAHVSFSEIGWDDWIIAPQGFDAYFCDGECPHRFKMASNFAGIQSVLHLNNPSKFPKLCCVPSKLSPLTILHKDDRGRYKFTDYKDLVVEDCRCA